MQWDAPVFVMMMFLARLAVPVLILLGLGYLYERWTAQQEQQRQRASVVVRQENGLSVRYTARPGYSASMTPCWEQKKCTAEQIANCPAAARRGVPCWITLQLQQGRLPDRCLDCEVFKDSSIQQTYVS